MQGPQKKVIWISKLNSKKRIGWDVSEESNWNPKGSEQFNFPLILNQRDSSLLVLLFGKKKKKTPIGSLEGKQKDWTQFSAKQFAVVVFFFFYNQPI